RAFADDNIIREGSVDPKSDYLTIETELMLADLQSVQNMQNKMRRDASADEKSALEKLIKALSDGKPARDVELTEEEQAIAKQWFLLSGKKELIVLNVSENDYSEENISKLIPQYAEMLGVNKDLITVVCAK